MNIASRGQDLCCVVLERGGGDMACVFMKCRIDDSHLDGLYLSTQSLSSMLPPFCTVAAAPRPRTVSVPWSELIFKTTIRIVRYCELWKRDWERYVTDGQTDRQTNRKKDSQPASQLDRQEKQVLECVERLEADSGAKKSMKVRYRLPSVLCIIMLIFQIVYLDWFRFTTTTTATAAATTAALGRVSGDRGVDGDRDSSSFWGGHFLVLDRLGKWSWSWVSATTWQISTRSSYHI